MYAKKRHKTKCNSHRPELSGSVRRGKKRREGWKIKKKCFNFSSSPHPLVYDETSGGLLSRYKAVKRWKVLLLAVPHAALQAVVVEGRAEQGKALAEQGRAGRGG